MCVCVCVCTLILLVFNVCASNTIHGQCLLLAPLVRGPQMVCVIVCMCVCVCVCVCERNAVCATLAYIHISVHSVLCQHIQAKATSTFTPIGLLSSNGLRIRCVHGLVYIAQNELIHGYARIKYALSSFHPHTHAHTHTHTHTHTL